MTNQTQNKRDSFIFYRSFYDASKCLKTEEKAQLFDAICSYALDEKVEQLDGTAYGMFQLVKPQLDANRKRFNNGCIKKQKRSKKEAKKKQTKSKIEANVNVNVNPNVNENLNLESKSKSLNFETFWNFYTPVAGRDGKSIDKGSKADAKKSYEKAIALNFSHETIMKALEFYLRECQKNARFTKHAVSWLNQAIRDEFKFEQTTVILPEAVPQKLTKDQQQDLINKQLEEMYANDKNF